MWCVSQPLSSPKHRNYALWWAGRRVQSRCRRARRALGIDGTDWAQTLHDAVALGASAGILSTFLYIVRHGALYYALGKWLLEWNRQLFDADVGPSPENVKYR